MAKDLIQRRREAPSRSEGSFSLVEHAVKGPVWDCQMCGQCVLHSTGMTCPMNCPKTLRNGPCGGVRRRALRGHSRDALRVAEGVGTLTQAAALWARPYFNHLRPPVDNQLEGTSSWQNLLTGRDRVVPAGWPQAASE